MHTVRNQKFLNRLAKNLKAARKNKGMSQEELAYKTGLALSQIARIETAKLNTTVSTVFAILQALDIDANELFK